MISRSTKKAPRESSPPPASPTAPTSQCAPTLDQAAMADPEEIKINTLQAFPVTSAEVDIEEPFYCEDCSIREAFIFGDQYEN